jgi:hypothetical protein
VVTIQDWLTPACTCLHLSAYLSLPNYMMQTTSKIEEQSSKIEEHDKLRRSGQFLVPGGGGGGGATSLDRTSSFPFLSRSILAVPRGVIVSGFAKTDSGYVCPHCRLLSSSVSLRCKYLLRHAALLCAALRCSFFCGAGASITSEEALFDQPGYVKKRKKMN